MHPYVYQEHTAKELLKRITLKASGKKGLKSNGNRCKNLLNVDLVRMLQEEEYKCIKNFSRIFQSTQRNVLVPPYSGTPDRIK